MKNQKTKCNICDTPVDSENLHPDSLEIPADGEYSLAHAGCANSEDRYNGAPLTDEQLADERGWVTQR